MGATIRNRLGSNTVAGSLLGQNITFNPGGKSTVTSLFGGISLEASLSDSLSVFANLEGSLEQSDTTRVSGNVGLKLQF